MATYSIQNIDGKPVFVAIDNYGGGYGSISIAADYTAYLARIATALETIATQQTTIATQQTTIATQQTTIATQQTTIALKQTAMETYQKKMKELSEGEGLHVIGPFEILGLLGYLPQILDRQIVKDIQKLDPIEFSKRIQELKDTLRYVTDRIGRPWSWVLYQ
jgi:uncharacterized coiled-coil protein SlyX